MYLKLLILFRVLGSGAFAVQYGGIRCDEAGNFSVIQDCATFVQCMSDTANNYTVSHCPPKERFDALRQVCEHAATVDCSLHHHLPLVQETPNTVGQAQREEQNVNWKRGKREDAGSANGTRVLTRPWGKWVDGDYLPYLVWKSKEETQSCNEKKKKKGFKGGRRVAALLGRQQAPTTTTPEPDEYSGEVLGDADDAPPEDVQFAPNVGRENDPAVKKKKISFKDDDAGGAAQEEKIAKSLNAKYTPYTQKPNEAFESPQEDPEGSRHAKK